MKKCIALFAAALLAGAASAVSVTWDKSQMGVTSGNGYNNLGLSENSKATIGAIIAYGGTIESGSILGFGLNHETDRIAVRIENGKYSLVGESFDSNIGNQTQITDISVGAKDILVLSIDRTLARPDTGVTGRVMAVSLYINGVLAAAIDSGLYGGQTWPGAYTHEGELEWLQVGQKVGEGDGYGGTYDVDVYYSNAQIDATEAYEDLKVKSVPEPTALALLALGVAGLALRRRCVA